MLDVTYEQFFAGRHSLLYPAMNNLRIALETPDISLSMNIVGKWSTPLATNSTGSTIQISEFLNEYVGIYTFYTYNWDGVEVGVVQIQIQSSPAIVGMCGIFLSILYFNIYFL